MKKILMMILAISLLPIALAQPLVLIDLAQQEPRPAVQGQTTDIYVTFTNTGQSDVRDLEVEFIDSNFVRLTSEQRRTTTIPVIGTFRDFTIKYTVQIDQNAPDGQVFANLIYRLGNVPGEATRNLPIQVRSAEPVVSISSVRTDPEIIVPGQEFDLTIAVRNLASAPVRDVIVDLDIAPNIVGGTIIQNLPFVPLTTNQMSINRINPSQTSEFTYKMVAMPSATADIYKLPLSVRYFDDSGNQRTSNLITGLRVNADAELLVVVDQSTLTTNQRTGDVTFLILNRGFTDIKMTTISLEDSDSFTLQSPSNTQYLGNIDSDDFDTVRYRITANEDKLSIPVKINYVDALNNEFSYTTNVELNLREGHRSGSAFNVILLLIIVGAIAYYVYRKKKKKKADDL
ncbi:MAG: COG1361 S-layer family protein [Candidatus Woesearchaeota archaeon]